MPQEKTEAVILKSFNWSESSRTVVFFSSDRGKLALIDKGGRRLQSKRGRLLSFAKLEVSYYDSNKESSGYIREVELLKHYSLEGDGALGRLAFASAACELLYDLLPEEQPQSALYQYFVKYLSLIESADKANLSGIFLAFFLRLLSQLGYNPSLAWCAACRKEIAVNGDSTAPLKFSPERGGVVCASCAKAGDYYILLSPASHRLLQTLQVASLTEAASLPIGYQETLRLTEALTKFVSFQTGTSSGLKSLEFLEKLKNSKLLK